MGQVFSCWACGRKNKVVPLKVKNSESSMEIKYREDIVKPPVHFHGPSLLGGRELGPRDVSGNRSNTSVEIWSLSNRSSLATISLGSVQSLSTSEEEIAEREGAANNRLQDEDIVHDREWQNSLPNIMRIQGEEDPLEQGNNRGLRAFSSMGRMAIASHKSPTKDNECLFEKSLSSHSSSASDAASAGTSTVYTPFQPEARPHTPGQPHLIMVQPCVSDSDESLGTSSSDNCISSLTTLPKTCPHGIDLSAPAAGADEDGVHVVRCVRCERPASCGGRALKGMVEFRRNDKRRRNEMEARRMERLKVERKQRRQREESVQEALRKFAETELGNEESMR